MSENLGATPSQTVGPFLSIALTWEDGAEVVPSGTPGAVTISGHLLDGAGTPVGDGVVETWQADPNGCFNHPDDPRGGALCSQDFRGFGRSATDRDGHWSVTTLLPGPIPAPDGRMEAPHLDVSVFARGLLDRVVTRIYFPDDEDALVTDPVLQSVPVERRGTLVAKRTGAETFTFDVILQGDDETVFFTL